MADYQQGVPIEISDTFTVGGVETNPTTVVYTLLGPDGVATVYTWPGAVEISNPSAGNFLLSLAPPDPPGLYQYDVDATGAVVASRAGSFNVLANVATVTDLDWAVVGPCSPWASSQDVWNCCGQPMTTIGEGSSLADCPVDMTQFAVEASQLLYELSGRLFSGSCERTVRPCRTNRCGFQVIEGGHVIWDPWTSSLWAGSNWWWDGRTCGCRNVDRVLLSGYPVREIVEVKIDGAVVDPTTYRLDERKWLTRVRDPLDPDTILLWPSCQNLELDDSQNGTFSVTYKYGQDPPLIGGAAAGELACELYKACAGQECALPRNATRISRQGIVVERLAFSAWAFVHHASRGVAPGWRTGMPLVDAFLGAYAGAGIKRRPTVWTASTKNRYARSVGQ